MTGAIRTPSSDEVTVERLVPDDWPLVRPLLRRVDPRIPDARWRTLFHHPWPTDGDHRGYALLHGGRITGYRGLVHSTRLVHGRVERFAGLTTWAVDPGVGEHALRLITPALGLESVTLVDLRPSVDAARWNTRWGFAILETKVVVMPCFGPWAWSSRAFWSTSDPDEVRHVLRGEPRRLADDHRAIDGCHVLVAGDGHGTCLVVASRIPADEAPAYALVHHLGDPDFLRRHHLPLRAAIAKATDTHFVAIDARLVGGVRLPLSWTLPRAVPSGFRSAGPGSADIDNLYSEMVLLRGSCVPGPLPEANALVGRVRRHVDGFLGRHGKEIDPA